MENTPLLTECSRKDLNINRDTNDEISSIKNYKDSNFPALKLNHDRQTHIHDNRTTRRERQRYNSNIHTRIP